MPHSHYIIDFDSTITRVEALDELADISLLDREDKDEIIEKIASLTNASMEGRLSFEESLKERIKLLNAHRDHIDILVRRLKKKISASFARNAAFFKKHRKEVLIVSGGFKEFIIPVLRKLEIKPEQIYANTFEYDKQGNIIGFDADNPLSKEGGKVMLLKQLNLEGKIYGIGDGYSDFQLRESGLVDKFFAFTENIERKIVKEKADQSIANFDEFLYENNLPRSISYPKSRIVLAAIGDVSETALKPLKKEGYKILVEAKPEDGDKDVNIGIIIASNNIKLSHAFIDEHPRLKVVGYLGKNKQNIDKQYLTEKGIVLFESPDENNGKNKFIPKRIIEFINKGETNMSSNFPNILLPKLENSHRLIHIHKNVLGVIKEINDMLWDNQANILGQYLRTNDTIGYVITDIDVKYDKSLIKKLKKISNTIKFRVLY